MKTRALLLSLCVGVSMLSPSLPGQTLLSAKPPTYPLEAQAAGIEGKVTLKGTVSKDGKMENIKVLSGRLELRQAAIEAAMSWQYKPYMQNGRPVDVDTTVTVNFNMGKGQEKAAAQAKARAQLAAAAQQDATPKP